MSDLYERGLWIGFRKFQPCSLGLHLPTVHEQVIFHDTLQVVELLGLQHLDETLVSDFLQEPFAGSVCCQSVQLCLPEITV